MYKFIGTAERIPLQPALKFSQLPYFLVHSPVRSLNISGLDIRGFRAWVVDIGLFEYWMV